MFDQPRKSIALQILEALDKRTLLSTEQQEQYERLSRGHIGEKKLAAYFKSELQTSHIPIYSLNLKVGGNECQIDCLLIFEREILLLEVKNFQGDYYFENNRWFSVPTDKEIKNPIHQLNRSELLLRELFYNQQLSLKITPYIIFVHPGFHLYESPIKSPIIFPSQLKRFVDRLHHLPDQLSLKHQKIKDQLTTNHIKQSAYEQIPVYDCAQLKKGIVCKNCNGFMETFNTRQLICGNCKIQEPINNAVIRSIKEFNLLFPNKQIRTTPIYHWCGDVIPKRGIRRILRTNFSLVNQGRTSYYME